MMGQMTAGQYTKLLKQELMRLLILDGTPEVDAKRAARPKATIDELKVRNTDLRKQLIGKGIDYRSDEQKAADEAYRPELLDTVEQLANAGGHDGAAKRAAVTEWSIPALCKLIDQTKRYQARQAFRQREEASAAAYDAAINNSPASGPQIAEILRVLGKLGGNPMAEGGFMNGPTTREEIAKMTRSEASTYLDSLKGNY